MSGPRDRPAPDQAPTEQGQEVREKRAEVFDAHRRELFGAAYRILASVHDADDIVQDSYLRWARADPGDGIRNPRSYLMQIVTRLALNRLRNQDRLRESYIGPWLPEPVADSDPEAEVEFAESVSMGMLVVLASLSPPERVTFVLKDVFDVPYSEIAATLGKSEAAVRQLCHRAREHVHARAPRNPVDRDTHIEATERLLDAINGGDVNRLLELMAPDVVLTTDGGGLRKAALRPIHGPDKIVRWMAGVMAKPGMQGMTLESAHINGRGAIVARVGGEIDSVVLIELEDGLVSQIFAVRNPEKLGAVQGRSAG